MCICICVYIYIYIYIYIHTTLSEMEWGIRLVKTIFPTSFGRGRSQGICRICDLQVVKDV